MALPHHGARRGTGGQASTMVSDRGQMVSDGGANHGGGRVKGIVTKSRVALDPDWLNPNMAMDYQARKWLPSEHVRHQPNSTHGLGTYQGPGGKQGGWASELEGISEKRVVKKKRIKRKDSTGLRSGRKGFHSGIHSGIELQGMRKYASRREHLILRRDGNPARMSRKLSESKATFPLANLEAYLKERRPSSLVKESMGFSPTSGPLSYAHNSNSRLRNMSARDCSSNLRESSVMPGREFFRTYGSENEAENVADSYDTEAIHSERSGCGMPWHWRSHGERIRHNSQLIGRCLSLPKKKVGKRNRLRYRSERSVSSFDSDTETVPLMTEPEPCQDDSDDLGNASGVFRVERHGIHQRNQYRLKDCGRDASLLSYPGVSQELGIRRSKEVGGIGKPRSLSQKYRPKYFKDLIGQNMVAESLSNAILCAKIAPVYLFHGPRGTGKTIAAKIFTNAMNCLSIEELRPCGLCKACMAFNAGQNYEVKQVDAAGNGDVDSMQLLLKHVSVPPVSSRYKVFIVDGCHLLTPEAWNALLKSLEEPPSYVVFILITTDLERLPRIAISRCQKFMFSRIKDADIVFRLRRIALQESIEIEPEALHFIASRSDGSFQDAENMLDRLSLLGSKVNLATVQEMVGLIPDEKLLKLLELALSADTVNTVNSVRELMELGVEPLALTSQLATLITDILAGKWDANSSNTVVKVKRHEQERLKQALMVLIEAEKQLRSCSDRTTWLTAAFLQFAPKEPCLLPSVSRATSVTQSPITLLLDGSEKEAMEPDTVSVRMSWTGDEMWDPHSPLQDGARAPIQTTWKGDGELKQSSSHGMYFSGPLDNRIHPCDHSPQSSGVAVRESKSVRSSSSRFENVAARESRSVTSPSTVDNIWKKVIQFVHSNALKQVLLQRAKLVSLAVTEACVVAYVEFEHLDQKAMVEKANMHIVKAFQMALGCRVEVKMGVLNRSGESNSAFREDNPSLQQKCGGQQSRRIGSTGEDDWSQQHERTVRGGSFRTSPGSLRSHSRTRDVSAWSSDVQDKSKAEDISAQDVQPFHHAAPAQGLLRSSIAHAQVHNHIGSACSCCKDDYGKHGAENGHPHPMHVQGSDSAKYCSDSEAMSDGDVPGPPHSKGACPHDTKQGRHHVRRRRRKGRLLLRLVPCARGGGRR